jgi:cell division topological specificity factor
MSMLTKGKPSSAALAKERLQFIIGRERSEREGPEYLHVLSRELRELVHRHISVSPADVEIGVAHVDGQDVLEMSVLLPSKETAGGSGAHQAGGV